MLVGYVRGGVFSVSWVCYSLEFGSIVDNYLMIIDMICYLKIEN